MKKVIVFIIITLIVAFVSLTGFAHSGGTDSNGGHYDRSTGDYHYHHGYPAHDHKDTNGDGIKECPYATKTTQKPVSSSSSSSSVSWGDILLCVANLLTLVPIATYFLAIVTLIIIEKFRKKPIGKVPLIIIAIIWYILIAIAFITSYF